MEPLNVVFMGTPDFATPSLNALANAGHRIQAVFCQPDRPKGRSKKPVACPVKLAAIALDAPVHQPRRIRAKKWTALLRELEPDLIAVAAYGQILPQRILDIPRLGCLNVHASILPRWRGASPVHYAILEGDAETGVSIMGMEAGLDTGPVYRVASMAIDGSVGRMALESKLADMGAKLLTATLPELASLKPTPQDPALATYAPIIEKSFGCVDFSGMDAARIARMTRAFEGWPGVSCRFREAPLKILEAATIKAKTGTAAPGEMIDVGKARLVVACAGGTALALSVVQPPGKKPQPIAAFINGYRPEPGDRFENGG